jgi:hypothetical protein
MRLAQVMLERGPTKPWFLLTESATIRTTADEGRVRVPDDFIVEAENLHLYYIPDDTDELPVKLAKDEFDTLKKNFAESDPDENEAAEPQAYALIGDYFYIFPTPDALYQIEMRYLANAAALTANIENGWLKYNPYVLIGKTGWLVAKSINNDVAASTFSMMEKEGRLVLAADEVERDLANRELQIGGPH